MTELTPYISRATPLSPSKAAVLQRPSDSEGMREVSRAFDTAQKVLETTIQHQSSFKAQSDFLQASVEAEKTFADKVEMLKGKDESEINKGLKDIIDKDVRPHYSALLSNISDPTVGRNMALEADKAIKQFEIKALHYELGLRVQRSEESLKTAALSSSNSVLLDGSNANFEDKARLFGQTIHSTPLDPKTKEKINRQFLSDMGIAQATWHMHNNPNVFSPFIRSKPSSTSSKLPDDASLGKLIDKDKLEVKEAVDLSKVNTVPFKGWEFLSTEKKVSLINSIAHSSTQGKQEEKSRLGEKIKDLSSFLDRGIVSKQLNDADVSADNLRRVYGDTLGSRLSSQLQYQAELVAKMGSLFTSPTWREDIKKFEPQPHELTGASFKNKVYSQMVKAGEKNEKERKETPIKWAKERGLTQELPEDPSKYGEFFVERRGLSQTMDKMYKVKSPILDKSEGRKLTEQLDNLESKDVIAHLEAYSEFIEGLNSPAWVETMRSLEHPVIGEAGLLLSEVPEDAQDLIRGFKTRTRNKGDNIRDDTGERFDSWFKERFIRLYGQAFASLGDYGDAEFDRAIKLVGYHLVGQLARTKKFRFNDVPEKTTLEWLTFQEASSLDGDIETSVKAILGNTPVDMGNGSYLIPPRGMDHKHFNDVFTQAKYKAFADAGNVPSDCGFENWAETARGERQYAVKRGRAYIRDPKTNEQLIITIREDQ